MSDVRISQLTATTTPALTDYLVGDFSGTTQRVSLGTLQTLIGGGGGGSYPTDPTFTTVQVNDPASAVNSSVDMVNLNYSSSGLGYGALGVNGNAGGIINFYWQANPRGFIQATTTRFVIGTPDARTIRFRPNVTNALDVLDTAITAYVPLDIESELQVVGDPGTSGYYLKSNGPGVAPSWAAVSGGAGTVTTVSVVSANGFAGTVANATSTPAITLTTSITGVLKGNGTAISAATAGTDYLAPPSGTALLKANSGGALANATAGTDYLAPPSGTALLKANSGGALANAVVRTDYAEPTTALATGILKNTTTTGAHSIAVAGTDYQAPIGTISGIAKGNGANALTAAVAGTDYQAPIGTISGIAKGNGANALTAAVAGTDYLAPPSGTALLKANSGGALANAVVRTDYAEPTTALATGILKNTTTTGAHSIAVAGTDYLAPPSGTAILKANSGGALANATAGTDYSAGTAALTTGILKSTTTTGALSIAVSGTDYQAPIGTISGIAKGNGANALTAAVAGTDYLAPPSGTAILKANSGGALANAVSGTDYAPATSGSSILYGNGSGGFSSVTVGSGLSFATGTLSNSSPMTYPGSGIPNSTGSAWGTSYTTTGSGTVIVLQNNPTFTGTVTLAADPAANLQAATKQYVDNAATGIDNHPSCACATTANITLSGLQTLDGYTTVAGDRVLVKNQTTSSQNGIYVAASGAWSYAADWATGQVKTGSYTFVSNGTTLGKTGWTASASGTITVGTTAVTFNQFSAANSYTNGTGLSLTGNQFSLSTPVTVGNGGSGVTTITGIIKGNGASAFSAATAGTDYLAPPSGTAILKANSGGALANATAGTDYSAGTSALATGILKSTTSTGALSIATAGTDYLAPPSGTALLKANSGGALANATAGTDYLAPPSGTALLKANSGGALANAVVRTDYAEPTTALATGILKNTTTTGAHSIAVAGTDYLAPPSGTALLKANSGGALANAVVRTDYAEPTTALATGILKNTTTTGAHSIAVAGTDYAPATSGSSILSGNGSGGFSNVTVGSGLSFSAGTLSASGGGGGLTGWRNKIINGDMRINQRWSTAQSVNSRVDVLDRWYALATGPFSFTVDQIYGTPTAGFYALRLTGANSSANGFSIGQRIESIDMADMVGNTCVASFKCAASGGITSLTWTINYPTATDNYASVTQLATGTVTISPTETSFSFTFTPTSTTGLEIVFTGGAIGTNFFYLRNVQIEVGSTATAFEYRPYATEMLMCQRFCRKAPMTKRIVGQCFSTTRALIYWVGPVMRSTSLSNNLGTSVCTSNTGVEQTVSSVSATGDISGVIELDCTMSAAVLAQGNATTWRSTSSSGFVSCEL